MVAKASESPRAARPLLTFVAAGCLLAGCGGGGTAASDDSREDTCPRPPGDADLIRSARPSATRFAGDAHVGPLRWVAEHRVLEGYAAVGTPRNGVVPVTGGSAPESDYGAPTREHLGVLSLRNGSLLWRRPGTFDSGIRQDAPSGGVLTAGSRWTDDGAFDLRTGRTLRCGLPPLRHAFGDGTAVSVTRSGALTRLRLRDGAQLWSRPATHPYTVVKTGDGVAAGTTGANGGVTDSIGNVGVHRLSDGRPLWDVTGRALLGVASGRVLLADRNHVTGHRARDGKKLWSQPLRWGADASYTLAGGRLLVAAQGRVTAYRTSDGTVAWDKPTGELPDLTPSASSGGLVYAPVRERNGLHVIDPRRGTIDRTLTGVVGGTYNRDVAAGEGVLVVQDGRRTLAFTLPRQGLRATAP